MWNTNSITGLKLLQVKIIINTAHLLGSAGGCYNKSIIFEVLCSALEQKCLDTYCQIIAYILCCFYKTLISIKLLIAVIQSCLVFPFSNLCPICLLYFKNMLHLVQLIMRACTLAYNHLKKVIQQAKVFFLAPLSLKVLSINVLCLQKWPWRCSEQLVKLFHNTYCDKKSAQLGVSKVTEQQINNLSASPDFKNTYCIFEIVPGIKKRKQIRKKHLYQESKGRWRSTLQATHLQRGQHASASSDLMSSPLFHASAGYQRKWKKSSNS